MQLLDKYLPLLPNKECANLLYQSFLFTGGFLPTKVLKLLLWSQLELILWMKIVFLAAKLIWNCRPCFDIEVKNW